MGSDVVSLEALAAQINAKVAEAGTAYHSALERAKEAGELLAEAKQQVGHGKWLPWLEANCRVSADMAGKWMKLARQWPELEARYSERVPYLGVKQALRLLAKPRQTKGQTELAGEPLGIERQAEAVTEEDQSTPDAIPAGSSASLMTTGQDDPALSGVLAGLKSVDDLLRGLEAILSRLSREGQRNELERVERWLAKVMSPFTKRTSLTEIKRQLHGSSIAAIRREVGTYVSLHGERIWETDTGEAVSADLANEFVTRQKALGWKSGRPLLKAGLLDLETEIKRSQSRGVWNLGSEQS